MGYPSFGIKEWNPGYPGQAADNTDATD